MHSESTDEDMLSIPLVRAVRETKMTNTLADRIVRFVLIVIFFPACAALYFFGAVYDIVLGGIPLHLGSIWEVIKGACFMFLVGFGEWIYFSNKGFNGNLLKHYNADGAPVFQMNSEGIICPAILLSFPVLGHVLESGQDSIRIKWEDIDYCDIRQPKIGDEIMAVALTDYGTGSGCYTIRLMENAAGPIGRNIVIVNTGFSADERQRIELFAARHLPEEVFESV
jgi:hypothetical protein